MKPLRRAVAEKIRARCARDEVVVVVPRRGEASRVFALEKYLKVREAAKRLKPHTHRRKRVAPDPLGAVDGKVLRSLRREELYDDAGS